LAFKALCRLELGDGLDGGPFGAWFWALCLVFVASAALLVYFNRVRLVPALQTSAGSIITGSASVSRKQIEAAVKNSALTPPDGVYKSTMERVEETKE